MIFSHIDGGVTAPRGFVAAGVYCGIRKNKQKLDLAMIYSKDPCAAAAVYTTNKVKGAPLEVTQANLADGYARAVICNSGNANTCNADGVEIAQGMCQLVGQELEIGADEVIVASTGVIGQPLPMEPIAKGIPQLVKNLSKAGGSAASEAIMTTDLIKKEVAIEFVIDGKACKIGAMAKGSGMIHPNMATMLCFITTDVSITPQMLQKALTLSVEESFNMVSVDGDTSTNDMAAIMASGLAGNPLIAAEGEDFSTFVAALDYVNHQLAKMIAADGEGATKLIIVEVKGAFDKESAKAIAKSVATSNLCKTAMFGADANWGRVLCAIGYAPAKVDVTKVDLAFQSCAGKVEVCKKGAGIYFDEVMAKKILSEKEITVDIKLGDGEASAIAYGCDLTYDYVKINGDYRT